MEQRFIEEKWYMKLGEMLNPVINQGTKNAM